jgi:hypothetical protein
MESGESADAMNNDCVIVCDFGVGCDIEQFSVTVKSAERQTDGGGFSNSANSPESDKLQKDYNVTRPKRANHAWVKPTITGVIECTICLPVPRFSVE